MKDNNSDGGLMIIIPPPFLLPSLQGLMQLKLVSNDYVAEDGLIPPVVTSGMLGLQVCQTRSHVCHIGDQPQDSACYSVILPTEVHP